MVELNVEDELDEIISRYSGDSGDLIPLLQQAQQKFGYLPREAIERIAKFLRLSESTVYGVATFYAQFKFTPSGRRIVRVCRGTACHVRGGARILREVEKQLTVKPGETTEDWEYTLETVACIGACALAPTMTVDKETHGEMTTKKVTELFGDRKRAE